MRQNWDACLPPDLGGFEMGAVSLMAAIAALVFANAVGRYAFAHPLPWTEELVIVMLVWVAAIGIAIAATRRSLISCDVLVGRLSARTAQLVAVTCYLFAAAVILIFAWLTWRYLGIFGRDQSAMLHIPKAVPILGLLFAALGLAAAFLASPFRR